MSERTWNNVESIHDIPKEGIVWVYGHLCGGDRDVYLARYLPPRVVGTGQFYLALVDDYGSFELFGITHFMEFGPKPPPPKQR